MLLLLFPCCYCGGGSSDGAGVDGGVGGDGGAGGGGAVLCIQTAGYTYSWVRNKLSQKVRNW